MISQRDQQALDAATAAGLAFLPTAASNGEMSPQRGAFISLTRHLARLQVSLSPTQTIGFLNVFEAWPEGWTPSLMPCATLDDVYTTPSTSAVCMPITNKDGSDLLSADGLWGLWLVGEDIGEGVCAIHAQYYAHTRALHEATLSALKGDLDTAYCLRLPLPEAAIPPPFRAQFAVADFPVCEIVARDAADGKDDGPKQNAWRSDIKFRWRAPRLEARKRLNDFSFYASPRVGPPGQEIRLCRSRDVTISTRLPRSS